MAIRLFGRTGLIRPIIAVTVGMNRCFTMAIQVQMYVARRVTVWMTVIMLSFIVVFSDGEQEQKLEGLGNIEVIFFLCSFALYFVWEWEPVIIVVGGRG